MFSVVVRRRKRGAWSARTVAVSLGVHLLLLGGIAAAAANTVTTPQPEPPDSIRWIDPQQKQHPQPAASVKPPAPTPAQPRSAPETTPTPQFPDSTPTRIDPPKPGAAPPPADPGEGPAGPGSAGPEPGVPAPGPQPPSGGTDPLLDSIFKPDAVEQLPQLLDPRGTQRLLERMYPGMLRDAGVTGRTTVLLVIDRNGAVEPGSVTVQETTHEGFREAAVRAAARFRFRPARVRGQPVPVWISLPIEWTIQR